MVGEALAARAQKRFGGDLVMVLSEIVIDPQAAKPAHLSIAPTECNEGKRPECFLRLRLNWSLWNQRKLHEKYRTAQRSQLHFKYLAPSAASTYFCCSARHHVPSSAGRRESMGSAYPADMNVCSRIIGICEELRTGACCTAATLNPEYFYNYVVT